MVDAGHIANGLEARGNTLFLFTFDFFLDSGGPTYSASKLPCSPLFFFCGREKSMGSSKGWEKLVKEKSPVKEP
jgi:hypothetical protein